MGRVRTPPKERIRLIRSFMANCSSIERGRQECVRRESALPLATGHSDAHTLQQEMKERSAKSMGPTEAAASKGHRHTAGILT